MRMTPIASGWTAQTRRSGGRSRNGSIDLGWLALEAEVEALQVTLLAGGSFREPPACQRGQRRRGEHRLAGRLDPDVGGSTACIDAEADLDAALDTAQPRQARVLRSLALEHAQRLGRDDLQDWWRGRCRRDDSLCQVRRFDQRRGAQRFAGDRPRFPGIRRHPGFVRERLRDRRLQQSRQTLRRRRHADVAHHQINRRCDANQRGQRQGGRQQLLGKWCLAPVPCQRQGQHDHPERQHGGG